MPQASSHRNAERQEPTTLGYVMLGLIRAGVTTGYAIVEIFKHTPMRVFSSSPGSIYPAIRRLKSAGYVSDARPDAGGKARLSLTESGAQIFETWLRRPVVPADVAYSSEELLLRFAFMSGQVPEDVILTFLADFGTGLTLHADQNAAFAGLATDMTLTGRLALEAGQARLAAYIDWCDRASHAIEQDRNRHG